MDVDISRLTNGEIEDMEEYAGRPVMGLLNRAIQEASIERTVKGKDPVRGTPLVETIYEIDTDKMLELLPAKVITALTCVTKRRSDPTFTMDKWRNAPFGGEVQQPNPLTGHPSSTSRRKRSKPPSTENSPNSEKSASANGQPSAISTPDTRLTVVGSSRKKS